MRWVFVLGLGVWDSNPTLHTPSGFVICRRKIKEMKKNLLLVLTLSVVAILVSPNIALAQITANITITGLIANVAAVAWKIAAILVIVFWVITGVLFLSSMGDPGKLALAKNSLYAAVAGTILVVLAYSAGFIIENAILWGT